MTFFDQSGNNPTSWEWIFEGGAPASSTSQNPEDICYNASGTYDVTLITTNGFGTDTLVLSDYITVNPTPPFPTITQVGYTLSSSVAASYQWQLNSTDIAGATNQSYTVLQTGFYTIIITDSNGCENSATQYVLISGIEESDDANVFVYPNPSSGSFIVELFNSLIAGDVSIDVVNTLSQKVFSSNENVSGNDFKKEIDLGDIACGFYHVEIRTGNEFVRRKVIVAK